MKDYCLYQTVYDDPRELIIINHRQASKRTADS